MSHAESNRPALLAEVERIKAVLADQMAARRVAPVRPAQRVEALDGLCERLEMSAFERDLLLLLATVQLDGDAAGLVGQMQGGDPRPTFALAMRILVAPHWDALSPDRPLRRWDLVELGPGSTLVTRPLTIVEHVLHTLTGLSSATRLGGLVVEPWGEATLTASQSALADEVVAAVRAVDGRVLVALDGIDTEARGGVAEHVAAGLGLRALPVRDGALAETDQLAVATQLDREALIGDRLIVTGHDRLVSLLEARVVVGQAVADSPGRTVIARTVDLPTSTEQVALWSKAVEGSSAEVQSVAVDLAHHYRLSARSIGAIAAEWTVLGGGSSEELRRLTRERARVGLGALAERIDVRAKWDDLVLPEGQKQLLADLVAQVRQRAFVYDDWGFGQVSNRGLGITALFAGESGTGKTMAAEVIAGNLGLDLFRIDLSAVVSKYIGETEKNLRSVFDAAEAGGAVLLFDEADALFGKRSDVKDSHDRYANLEVAYLLQRMESYRGLAILTTNLRSNVDRAFVRRLRFVVQFPFPDEASRMEIWRHAFPAQTPVAGHDPAALARLQVSGGSIRSIAVSAAFAAADEGSMVEQRHILRAAQVEYAKAERTLTASETSALRGGAR